MKDKLINNVPEWIIFCAFRYCLGRMTYIVSMMAEWLVQNMHNISKGMRDKIASEIESEKEPIGMEMDNKQWQWVHKNYTADLIEGEYIEENSWCSVCGREYPAHRLPNGELYCPNHEPEKREQVKMQKVLKKFVGDKK